MQGKLLKEKLESKADLSELFMSKLTAKPSHKIEKCNSFKAQPMRKSHLTG